MKKFYHLIHAFLLLAAITSGAKGQTTFTVTTNLDNGNDVTPLAGSLREAIINANTNGTGPDIINFNIPGAGVHTISPLTNPLPSITAAVTIDGYSQGTQAQVGSVSRVINIEIDGTSVPNVNTDGLTINSNDVTIDGIAVFNFNGNGISLLNSVTGNNFFVWGCNIGLTAAGTVPTGRQGNIHNGIFIEGGGNVHSQIHIGSNLDGTNDANEGNVISSNNVGANGFDGIQINATVSSNFSGNFIGVDGTGNAAAPNGRNGILFLNCHPANFTQRNLVGTDGDNVNDATESNILSRNANGVSVLNSEFTVIAGNSIGLFANGSSAGNTPFTFPTSGSGILFWGSANNVIGTNGDGSAGEANEKNFICSNSWNGISLVENSGVGGAVSGNMISGNSVGVGLDGVTPLGNTNFGIGLVSTGTFGVFNNIIGSDDNGTSDALEGNLIANNGLDGFGIFANGTVNSSGNRLSRNSYFNNSSSAINLNVFVAGSPACNLPNSCTPAGNNSPNNFFDHPVLESVNLSGSTVSFKGWAIPGSTVQFYLVDGTVSRPCTLTPENLDFEEGKTFLISAVEGSGSDLDAGSTAYSAALEGTNPGVSCTASRFQFDFPFTALGGTVIGDPTGSGIVAIAISNGTGAAAGSTSQFSGMVVATGALPVTLLNFDAAGSQGKVTVSWSTATETNSDYFDVERSADGVHFATVGTVNAKGNSTTITKYSLVDGNPINGVSYYRLKQVDLDGKFVYTKVVIVRSNGSSARVLISPNPARTHATITLTLDKGQSLQVRVFDNTGRAARTYRFNGAAGVNQFDLNDIGNLPSGVYNVEIIGSSTHVRERFVKN